MKSNSGGGAAVPLRERKGDHALHTLFERRNPKHTARQFNLAVDEYYRLARTGGGRVAILDVRRSIAHPEAKVRAECCGDSHLSLSQRGEEPALRRRDGVVIRAQDR